MMEFRCFHLELPARTELLLCRLLNWRKEFHKKHQNIFLSLFLLPKFPLLSARTYASRWLAQKVFKTMFLSGIFLLPVYWRARQFPPILFGLRIYWLYSFCLKYIKVTEVISKTIWVLMGTFKSIFVVF